MQPDYERAALRATEILIEHGIKSAPVSPLPILKSIPNVLVMSYEDVATVANMDRRCVMSLFGDRNQDAFTSVDEIKGVKHYLVTYNQRLPLILAQRGLARELGHIVLGHDDSVPEEVRNEEAKCFSHHLLCPRPLIHSLQATALRITTEVIGNITGCYDYCLSCMRRMPGVHIPAELNRKVRDQFVPYIINFFDFQSYAQRKDVSTLADFGTYMDYYEE